MNMTKHDLRLLMLHEFKLGHNASEASANINRAWGEESTRDRTVRRWFGKFRSGDESLKDEDGRGRLGRLENEHAGETAARVGEVTWRVRWESSRVRLDALHVVLRHTTFHGAAVTWGVTFDGEHHPGDESGELRLENLCSRAANKAAVNPKSSSVRSTSSIHTSRDSTKTNNNTSATGNSALSDNAAKCSLDSKLRKTSPLQITKRSGDNAGVSQRRSSASPNSRITTQRGKGADAGKSKTDVRPTSCNVKLTKGRDVRDSTPIDNIKSTAINNNTKDSRSASASRGAFNGTTENMSVSNRSSSIDGRSKSVTSSQMLDNSACALDNSPRDGHTSGELVVRAVLSGGEGDNAWQHAQLFRMPDDDVDSAPFIIELNFQ
ncbi:Peptide N glycanase PAW domain [Trinorchestia longiramus]|nr:Peptide N glycanase PAW domain [Trinorchestia longiramus]